MSDTIKPIKNQKHVHFMGICGSGCASIALLAFKEGFRVSGCDQSTTSFYADALKELGIRINEGHDPSHLEEDVDIVAVSPAIFDISPDNPELLLAQEKGILMTWQEFMGKYLQKDKEVICISGTHGKTTTTFLTAELLIDAGLDPSVVGGSLYEKWNNGGHYGKSDLFVVEADEFNRNFHHYNPTVALLNNVEMDHPECYKDFDEVIDSFRCFLLNATKLKTVIFNADSEGAVETVLRTVEELKKRNVRFIALSNDPEKFIPCDDDSIEYVRYFIDEKLPEKTRFTLVSKDSTEHYTMGLMGDFNAQNAASACIIASLYKIPQESIQKTLSEFHGVGRRFDRVGELRNIPVYDDYAHHPTEIHAVLTLCRDHFKGKRVLAVFEPHQVSRLRMMFDAYVASLLIADEIIIMKTHLGREIHKNVKPISVEEWEGASGKIKVIEDPEGIKAYVNRRIDEDGIDMIVVIGAANSYKISRFLCGK